MKAQVVAINAERKDIKCRLGITLKAHFYTNLHGVSLVSVLSPEP